MNASPQLQASIEELYEVFSACPVPKRMDCCPCGCNRADHAERLYAKPLRQLDRDDLDFYSFCALTTMGNEADFKHFLPRLFYLSVAISPKFQLHTSRQILFGKMTYANWNKRPDLEKISIRSFFRALWENLLSDLSWRTVDFSEFEEWICNLAAAEDNLSPYLDVWLNNDSLESCVALASLILESAISTNEDSGRDAFWDERDNQYLQLKRWVHSPQVASKLEFAAEQWASTPEGHELLAARNMLHNYLGVEDGSE